MPSLSTSRRITAGLCVIVACVVLIAVIHGCRSKFDPGRWKDCVSHGDCMRVRDRMASDLIEGRVLLGKTEAEVLDLLGKPDAEHRGPKDQATVNPRSEFLGHRADVEFNYELVGSLDPDILAVYFKGGVVYKVIRHRT